MLPLPLAILQGYSRENRRVWKDRRAARASEGSLACGDLPGSTPKALNASWSSFLLNRCRLANFEYRRQRFCNFSLSTGSFSVKGLHVRRPLVVSAERTTREPVDSLDTLTAWLMGAKQFLQNVVLLLMLQAAANASGLRLPHTLQRTVRVGC